MVPVRRHELPMNYLKTYINAKDAGISDGLKEREGHRYARTCVVLRWHNDRTALTLTFPAHVYRGHTTGPVLNS